MARGPRSRFKFAPHYKGAALCVSTSGIGLHIYGWSSSTVPHCNKNTALGIEYYTDERFIACTLPEDMTGEVWADYVAQDDTGRAFWFPPNTSGSDEDWTTEPRSDARTPSDDGELIRRMLLSSDRGKWEFLGVKASPRQLWEGDEEALTRFYPDPGRDDGGTYGRNEADLALCAHLAYWTGKDCERMERLFGRSALGQRDKWTSREGYRHSTVLCAHRGCDNVYNEEWAKPSLLGASPGRDSSESGSPAGADLPGISLDSSANHTRTQENHATLEDRFRAGLGSVARFLNTAPPARQWVVQDLIPSGLVGSLVATGGTGKGHLEILLSIRVALGLDFGPFSVPSPQRVLFISMEDENDEAHRRIGAAMRLLPEAATPSMHSKLAANFCFVDLLGAGHAGLEILSDLITRTANEMGGVGLIVIDPLAKVLPPESVLNEQSHVATIISQMDQIASATGAAVLFAHHTNKSAAREGTQLSSGSSTGSMQIEDLSRYVIGLKTLSAKQIFELGLGDDVPGYVQLHLVKGNYQPPQSGRVIFQRCDGGALRSVEAKSKGVVAREVMLDVLPELPAEVDLHEWDTLGNMRGLGMNKASQARIGLERDQRVHVEIGTNGRKTYRRLPIGGRHPA